MRCLFPAAKWNSSFATMRPDGGVNGLGAGAEMISRTVFPQALDIFGITIKRHYAA
jgi:hypothetical protein